MGTTMLERRCDLYEPTIYFVCGGVYVPELGPFGVEWYLNTDGDPWVGVQVDSVENAARFAEVIVVEVERGA